jgi:hypothetical protein
MVVAQKISICDMANCSTVAELLIRILFYSVIILMTEEAYFHLTGRVSKQNFRY